MINSTFSMHISRPSESDYQELTDVWEASVRATHHFLKEEDIAFFRPLVLKEFLKVVQLHCIKDNKNAIQGFIGTSGEAIEMLFVNPAVFGCGIGKALIEFSIELLGCKKVDVNEDNPQAIRFYAKMGFKIKGRSETDAFGKPYPLLHMEL